MQNEKFSQRLSNWLSNTKPKTLKNLIDTFQEKSFAVIFLLLLIIPALPLPTGGITHVFEIIAMLVALELIAGKKTIWLPKNWSRKDLPTSLQNLALPKFINIISWVEKYSKPRFRVININSIMIRIIAVSVLIFTVFAFLAPPFSGLDTLPALGVVLLSLALIFEDILLTAVGLVLGCVGIGLILFLGSLIFKLF
jgi:hypothetical protein